MPDQPSLTEGDRPAWWVEADEALVAEFYANGEGPPEQTERCRLCRYWLSADGWRGECHRAPLEVKPVTLYTRFTTSRLPRPRPRC